MNIFSIVVTAIVVLAWVIGAIAEQQRRAAKPPPLPPMPDRGDRGARSREELADFLEEIRRKAAAGESQPLQAILVEEPPKPKKAAKTERTREKPRPRTVPDNPAPRRSAENISQDQPSPAVATGRKPSPVAVELVKLTRNPNTLAAAVLLREILEPPRCKRRR